MSENAQGTQLAARTPANQLRGFLYAPAVIQQISQALPKHLTAERVLRQAMTLAQQNPGLMECTQSSILAGIIQASELGLELSGPLGQAYLVPRWDKRVRGKVAVFQVGYRGLIDLAFRSGKVNSFSLRTVYQEDGFSICMGTDPSLHHTPTLSGDPGPAIGYYSVVMLQGGGCDFEWMNAEQMREFAARFASSEKGPWTTDFHAMAMKTTARRLAKRVPLSVEFQTAAALDEYGEAGVQQFEPPAVSRTNALADRLMDAPAETPPVGEAAGDTEGEGSELD